MLALSFSYVSILPRSAPIGVCRGMTSALRSSLSSLGIRRSVGINGRKVEGVCLHSSSSDVGDTTTGGLNTDDVSSIKHPFLKTMRDRGYLFQCTNLKGE